ncbi:hypothetical protein JTB14_014341 [Gonioctena quinquepunctata]|nr:hypothetical protein JTB14_014341 [Gonioctena quinquepunctata]
MEKVFKCCKKNFNNLCCITCYDIFHLSCLDRRSDYKELGGYKIYCSTKCEEKDQKNKRNEENNLKEIRKLKNDIIQRDELMNKLGYEKEDKLNELQKKLHVLEREMKEKDAAYKREKRKTLDFEHDVIETDQKLAIILKENEQIIKKLNEKISDLSHTNEELQTKLKSQLEELPKKDDDLGELKEINKDIVSSIKQYKTDKTEEKK